MRVHGYRRGPRLSERRYAEAENYVPKWARAQESGVLWLRKRFVQRALAIAFQVQGNIGEARSFESLRDTCGHFRGKGARHFFLSDFDARELVVQAHAELAEAEVAQRRFAALDQAEALGGDFRAIGDARSEARGSGTI